MDEERKERQETQRRDVEAKRDFCVAPDGARPTTSVEAQLGRPLEKLEVIRKLKKLNSLLTFEVSRADPSKIGIYLFDMTQKEGRRFLCGMENGESPEFTIRKAKKVEYYDESSEAMKERLEFAGEIRGWRTILAKLIRAGIITKESAEREFDVLRGMESKNWQSLVN